MTDGLLSRFCCSGTDASAKTFAVYADPRTPSVEPHRLACGFSQSYSKTDEVKKLFLARLYNYYLDKETAKLKERNPKRSKFYKSYLEKINNQQSFQIGMIKSLDSICNEVDENIDTNEKAIRKFFRENKDRVQNKEILPDLEQAYLSDCLWYDRKITKEEMEKSFEKNTKRLNFEREVDHFLSKNKDSVKKFNKQYFDKAKFYRELEETDV